MLVAYRRHQSLELRVAVRPHGLYFLNHLLRQVRLAFLKELKRRSQQPLVISHPLISLVPDGVQLLKSGLGCAGHSDHSDTAEPGTA